jgi:AcrR family transcriptional regulator
MPRTPEQYEKIREGKRKLIMDTALGLFAGEGYHSTSISKIAAKAGISKGLMYNYFESKEALIHSIMEEGMKALTELFDPNKDGVLTDDEFDFFVNRSFDILRDNPTYWRLYFSIMMQEGIYELFKDRYTQIIDETIVLLLDYYKRQGVKDPETEALLFGAMMDGISMNYLLGKDSFPLEKMKKAVIERFGHKKSKQDHSNNRLIKERKEQK